MLETQKGRKIIYTDVPEITYENVVEVLRAAMTVHTQNVDDITFLLNYEAGEQGKIRKKSYRADIDCWCVDNVANEVSEFKQSYNWGNTITLTMREKDDLDNADVAKAVFELNRFYDLQSVGSKQEELARFVEITGVGYTYVDINTDYEDGESPFSVDVLNPSCCFIVRSSYYADKRTMLGVTYRCDAYGKKRFTCFSNTQRFEITDMYSHDVKSGERNPLGIIPIVEWIRSHDRMGCFERQISEMNNLNLLISDFTNDVEQNTQAIWHTNDIEFPEEVIKDESGNVIGKQKVSLKGNTMVQTYTSQDGKTPIIEPLSINYDYEGMLNNILARRALILQKCNVPARNDNNGGSTGVAMSDATGWTQADAEATRQDLLRYASKLQEVKVVLRAISKCPNFPIDDVIRKLKHSDCEANIPRQKTYELTTKVNSICALIGKGFTLEDSVEAIPLFDDNNKVIVRSGEGVKKYQDANVFNIAETTDASEKRPFPDLSDQENNSPVIGGMNREEE